MTQESFFFSKVDDFFFPDLTHCTISIQIYFTTVDKLLFLYGNLDMLI